MKENIRRLDYWPISQTSSEIKATINLSRGTTGDII